MPCLFSFHYDGKVFKGVNLNQYGIGVEFEELANGNFHFHRSQVLKDCYIEIEGTTIYFSRLKVCWLHATPNGLVYGFDIDSILPPQKILLDDSYLQAIERYRNSDTLTIAEQQALEKFYETV